MQETTEISALLHLIDDPDNEVFVTVSEKIVSLGKAIIPNLETLWENTLDEEVQERIELLIHRLHFQELQSEFTEWCKQDDPDLFHGALLVSKYQYPDLNITSVYQDFEKIRRNIWLELNNYLTPLEQVTIINNILYNYYKHKGSEISYSHADDFLIHKAIECKKGNSLANGILYLSLCEILDVPVKIINIPRQFILAYFDGNTFFEDLPANTAEKILFYLDPLNGQVYTQADVETYFKKISLPPSSSYFKPMNTKHVIQFLLKEFSRCFDDAKNQYKKNELLLLADMIEV
ncbi:MAG TPA: transglutaminase family protein [Chitinophagaceae bacterium]|nr:transglutaminase family protein [Chitinophagaceae bacterium]